MRFFLRSSLRSPRCRSDTGSAMPLVIGMVVCLLALGAGVTAATSAFLAHSRLQHVCDGAAAAAAGAAKHAALIDHDNPDAAATARAVTYVRARGSDVAIQATGDRDGAALTCTTEAPLTFGAMFGHSTLDLTTHAVGHAALGN